MRATVTPALALILPELEGCFLPAALGPGFLSVAVTRLFMLQPVSVFTWGFSVTHKDNLLVRSQRNVQCYHVFYLTPKDTQFVFFFLFACALLSVNIRKSLLTECLVRSRTSTVGDYSASSE